MNINSGSDARSTNLESAAHRQRLQARLAAIRAQQATSKTQAVEALRRQWADLLDQEADLQHWEGLITCRNIRWSHGWWAWAHDQNVALLEQMAAVVEALRALEAG